MSDWKDAPFFFCPPEAIAGKKLNLPPDESRHLTRVLRKKPGDLIQVTDGCGNLFTARVESCDARSTGCSIRERLPVPDKSSVTVILAVSMIRKERFEWLIEKATEIGVSRIRPLVTERTEPRAGGDRRDRWKKIAIAAMKQSRRTLAPEIDGPVTLSAFLSAPAPDGVGLLASPAAENTISVALRQPESLTDVRILVGPEGGFSPAETLAAEKAGYVPFRLSPAILRAETACLVAATLVIHHAKGGLHDPVAT